jgi:hypothetical protein
VVAVVLMASAPWVLLQPDQDVRTELNRWFLTVAGSVDAITAGVLLALAHRPRRTLLIVEYAVAIVAAEIILPFQPSCARYGDHLCRSDGGGRLTTRVEQRREHHHPCTSHSTTSADKA